MILNSLFKAYPREATVQSGGSQASEDPLTHIGGFISLNRHNKDKEMYDFRILDYRNSDNFKYLGYLNLIDILQLELETKYIKGYNIRLEKESFFERINDLEIGSYYVLVEDKDDDYILLTLNNIIRNITIFKTTNKLLHEKYFSLPYVDCKFDARKRTVYSRLDNNIIILQRKKSDSESIRFLKIKEDGRELIAEVTIPNVSGDDVNPFILQLYSNLDLKLHEVKLNVTNFYSLLFNCTNPPKFTEDELENGRNKIRDTEDQYDTYDREYMYAIDPSEESKDKDDAINFTFNLDNSGNGILTMDTAIADIYPYFSDLHYPMHYIKFKKETEYLPGKRFSMIDIELSEKILSLGVGPGLDRAVLVSITYEINNGKLNPIPLKTEISRVKDLKILCTTYEKFHNEIIDKDALRTSSPLYGEGIPSLNVCRSNPSNFYLKDPNDINVDSIFTLSEDIDKHQIKTDILNMHTAYELLTTSLESCNTQFHYNLKYEISDKSDQLFHDFYEPEKWTHKLIEITALETNTYVAMTQFQISKLESLHPLILTRENIIGLINDNFKDFFSNNDKTEFQGFYRGQNADIANRTYNYNVKKELSSVYFTNTTYYHQSHFNYDTLLSSNPGGLDSIRKIRASYHINPITHKFANITFYTHFTSPLRRFCDICVHNYLFSDNKEQLKVFFEEAYDQRIRSTDFHTYVSDLNKLKFITTKLLGEQFFGVMLINKFGDKIIYVPILNIEVDAPPPKFEKKSIVKFTLTSYNIKTLRYKCDDDISHVSNFLNETIYQYLQKIFLKINNVKLSHYELRVYKDHFYMIQNGMSSYTSFSDNLKYISESLDFTITPYGAYYYKHDKEIKLENYLNLIYYDIKNLENIATKADLSLFINFEGTLSRVNVIDNKLVVSEYDFNQNTPTFTLFLNHRSLQLEDNSQNKYEILAIYDFGNQTLRIFSKKFKTSEINLQLQLYSLHMPLGDRELVYPNGPDNKTKLENYLNLIHYDIKNLEYIYTKNNLSLFIIFKGILVRVNIIANKIIVSAYDFNQYTPTFTLFLNDRSLQLEDNYRNKYDILAIYDFGNAELTLVKPSVEPRFSKIFEALDISNFNKYDGVFNTGLFTFQIHYDFILNTKINKQFKTSDLDLQLQSIPMIVDDVELLYPNGMKFISDISTFTIHVPDGNIFIPDANFKSFVNTHNRSVIYGPTTRYFIIDKDDKFDRYGSIIISREDIDRQTKMQHQMQMQMKQQMQQQIPAIRVEADHSIYIEGVGTINSDLTQLTDSYRNKYNGLFRSHTLSEFPYGLHIDNGYIVLRDGLIIDPVNGNVYYPGHNVLYNIYTRVWS